MLPPWLGDKLFLKLTALALSLLLWGGVVAGRGGAKKIVLPVKVVNLAPGLAIRSAVPTGVEVSVIGPRLLLYRFSGESQFITLDFAGVRGGIVAFDNLGRDLNLNPGIEVIRTVPGRLQVWVEPVGNIPAADQN